MSIFQIEKNRYAIGNKGKKAEAVVLVSGRAGHGLKITGVRGVRPILDERFTVVKVAKEIATALNELA